MFKNSAFYAKDMPLAISVFMAEGTLIAVEIQTGMGILDSACVSDRLFLML